MMKQLINEWKSFLNEARVNTEQLKAELEPKFEQYAQVILDSIVNKQYFVMVFEVGGGRPIVVLDTQKGLLPFYRSTGTSSVGKEDGEWTITGGWQSSRSRNYSLLSKNATSFGLTQGEDRYLAVVALVLEYMWNKRMIQENCEPVYLNRLAKNNQNKVNQNIARLNSQEDKYIDYGFDELQGAYLNSFLDEMGVFNNSYLTDLFTNTHYDYIGIEEVRSEKITELSVANKFLPKLEDVMR